MTLSNTGEQVTYEQFCEQWLADIEEVGLSTLSKGRLFATKLITQWLEITTDDEDFFVCDGSGDGGIDIAYLKRSEGGTDTLDDNTEEGDTWYLVQSKYNTSFGGYATISLEGQKVIETLYGNNPSVSTDTAQLLEKLNAFRSQASPEDRIVLVFATTQPISQNARLALEVVQQSAREKVFENFDVEEVSLQTIWDGLPDTVGEVLSVSLKGQFVEQGTGLLVGTVSLVDLFDFLKSYRSQTGNLDQLYEKNVRQFLGSRRKINKGIQDTLNSNPEKFGLYNNGITMVVSDYSEDASSNIVAVKNPYIVNGCQTTRSIWQVLDAKLNAGGTGQSSTTEDWKDRAGKGGVVTKIVRSEAAEIINITRYTNSQNSVRAQDFIALQSGFQNWAEQMEQVYDIYLEIQRGGKDSRKAYEKQHPEAGQFKDYVSAFDLVKVYGAGWLECPGTAFRANSPFLPGSGENGRVYQQMVSRQESEPSFGVRDLYAAYLIESIAKSIGFGRNSQIPSRRQSRFLFYHIVMRMLAQVVILTPPLNRPQALPSVLTEAVVSLSSPDGFEQLENLGQAAVGAIDQYLTVGGQVSAYNEDSFIKVHNGDMNAFLKSDDLGKDSHTPLLVQSLAITNSAFIMTGGKDAVANVLLQAGI